MSVGQPTVTTDVNALSGTSFYTIRMPDGSELGMVLDQSRIWKACQVQSNAGAVIQFRRKEKSIDLDTTEPMYIVGAAWVGNTCKKMWLGVRSVGREDCLQWFNTFDEAATFNVKDIGGGQSALTIASYDGESEERGIRVNSCNGELLLDQSDMCLAFSCLIVSVKPLNYNIDPWNW